MSYVSKLIKDNDITFLCEHWLQVSEINSISDLFCENICFFKSSVNPEVVLNGRPYGGIGFVCKNLPGIRHNIIEFETDRIYGIKLIVSETVVLTVFGVYMPYENYSYEQMESYLETLDKLQIMLDKDTGKNNSPVIIVGDLNTRLPQSPNLNKLWYKSKPFNHRSYVLYNFLIENDLMVTNFNFPQAINYTYAKGNINSYTDHVFTPVYMLPMVKKCVVIHDAFDNLSDHKAFQCELDIPVPESVVEFPDNSNQIHQTYPKPIWTSDSFVKDYMNEISILADSIPDIDMDNIESDNVLSAIIELCDNICTVLHEATARSASKCTPTRGYQRKKWWSTDLHTGS